MPNFAVKSTDALDTINYLLAGNTGIGQENNGYWSGTGGYLQFTNYPPYVKNTYSVGPMPTNTIILTPALVDATVTSETDRVLITAQCRPYLNWTATDPLTNFSVYISVERVDLPRLDNRVELAQDNNNFQGNTGDLGDISIGDTIYVGIIDTPGIGAYQYQLTFYLRIFDGDPVVNWAYIENTSISATLIKK